MVEAKQILLQIPQLEGGQDSLQAVTGKHQNWPHGKLG